MNRHFLPVGVCPDYVTFIWDLHYGMPLALFVLFCFWSNVVSFESSWLLSNVLFLAVYMFSAFLSLLMLHSYQ